MLLAQAAGGLLCDGQHDETNVLVLITSHWQLGFVYCVQSSVANPIIVSGCTSQICAAIDMQVGGLHIRVDRAGQSAHGSAGGSVMYERNRTVFVGNLPFDVEVGFLPSCAGHLH